MSRVRGAPVPTLSSVVASTSQTVLMKETAVLDDQRDKSHERAMQTASWSIQSADRGNAGLQNAVSAAIASGILKEKTWVRFHVMLTAFWLSIVGWYDWYAN